MTCSLWEICDWQSTVALVAGGQPATAPGRAARHHPQNARSDHVFSMLARTSTVVIEACQVHCSQGRCDRSRCMFYTLQQVRPIQQVVTAIRTGLFARTPDLALATRSTAAKESTRVSHGSCRNGTREGIRRTRRSLGAVWSAADHRRRQIGSDEVAEVHCWRRCSSSEKDCSWRPVWVVMGAQRRSFEALSPSLSAATGPTDESRGVPTARR